MNILTDTLLLEQMQKQNFTLTCYLISAIFFTAIFVILLIKANKKKKVLLAAYISLITIGLFTIGMLFSSVQSFDYEDFLVTKDTISSFEVKDNKCVIKTKKLKLEKKEKPEFCTNIKKGEELYLVIVSIKSAYEEEKLGVANIYPTITNSYQGEKYLDVEKVKRIY